MIRKISVLLLLLSVFFVGVKAESLSENDIDSIQTESTTTTKSMYGDVLAKEVNTVKYSSPRHIQRIDRGVMQSVFIPKGQWHFGGTVSYSENEQENLNFLIIKNVEGLGYTFNISPYFGYFFKDNMAAGVRFGYSRSYLDLQNFEVNLGDGLNINLKDLYYLEHEYETSAFLRTYMPIGRSKIFGFFNELRLTYAYGVGKNSTGTDTAYDGTFQKSNSLQIGIAPGLSAFVTDWSAVEVSIGVMGYNFNWVKQKTNQIETGTRRTSSGNFKINLFSINIGMTFYL